jgi:hypothetical protein
MKTRINIAAFVPIKREPIPCPAESGTAAGSWVSVRNSLSYSIAVLRRIWIVCDDLKPVEIPEAQESGCGTKRKPRTGNELSVHPSARESI